MTKGSPLHVDERHRPDYRCTGEATYSVVVTARAAVYGTTMGSPLDDKERHSRDYQCTGEATVQP